jgi:hypothetical protein
MALPTHLANALVEGVTLAFNKKASPWIGIVHFDAAISETHTESGTSTEHPVEKGTDISDHFRVNPKSFSMEGLITNHPIRKPLSQADGVQEVDVEFKWEAPVTSVGFSTPAGDVGIDVPSAGIAGTATQGLLKLAGARDHTGTAKGFSPTFNRVGDCYNELQRLVEEATPVTIHTHLKSYDNMILENLSTTGVNTNIERNELNWVTFSVDCKQIRIVKTDVTQFDVNEPSTKTNTAKPKKQKGKTGTDELVSESVPHQVVDAVKDGVTGFFGG